MKMITIVICLILLTVSAQASDVDQCGEPVNGGWGEWSAWSICSVTCDSQKQGGFQIRRRECSAPIAKYGGTPCKGESEEKLYGCNADVMCPVNGNWSEWIPSGECSESCGAGMITYIRMCDNPEPQYCGTECQGPAVKVETCNNGECPTTTTTTTPEPTTTTTPEPTTTSTTREPTTTKEPSIGLACRGCYDKARANGRWYNMCRVARSECTMRANEAYIHGMHAGHGWYFLHCGADAAWCKPCGARNLVYNAKCGRCDWTRDAKC